MTPDPPLKPKLAGGVNSKVDSTFRLMPLSNWESRPRDRRRVRVLQIGERCEAQDALVQWSRSSPKEHKKVLARLRMMAESDDLPALKTIKRVGPERRILQIAGDSGRLFCFEDADGITIVCVSTFWIGGGDKVAAQNQAIQEAESLMARWRAAEIVPGVQDTRVEKRGK